MDAFPAFFPLAGRTVVIAGSGDAADAKARLFEGSPAKVVRVDGETALDPRTYEGATLAFIASADEAFVQAAAAAVRAAHVPLNVVDRPALCDFTTPSVVDRGEVVAAVGTGGASPMLAALLRHDLEVRIPQGAGRVAALFRQLQDEVRHALPEMHRRRAFLRAALSGPAARAAMDGDMDQAVRLLRTALASDELPAGEVVVIDGRGPVEALLLSQAQMLSIADILVCDPKVDREILGLARRDAQRLSPPQDLEALAAGGHRVVRLTS